MTDPFHRPTWVDELTDSFERALPTAFERAEPVAERHGSWQWTASAGAGRGPWLIAEATPLPAADGAGAEQPHIALAAWRLTPGARAIDEGSVVRRELTPRDQVAGGLTKSFTTVVQHAAREEHSAPPVPTTKSWGIVARIQTALHDRTEFAEVVVAAAAVAAAVASYAASGEAWVGVVLGAFVTALGAVLLRTRARQSDDERLKLHD